MRIRRTVLAFAATAALTALSSTAVSADPGSRQSFVVLRTRELHQAAKRPRTTNLFSHGGPVQTATQVYLSYWGGEWAAGFSTGGYTSAQAQTYIGDFFTNVGGSSWINSDTQYCQGVASGTVTCPATATFITNPTAQLTGTWNDTTTVPASPTQADIFNAAVRLMQHFAYSPQATYMVFTPHGKSMTGFATQWCAWHDSGTSGGNVVAYAYIPYQPDAGTSCGMNFVNGSNNSYGNGYFDGFSIVAGHEYEEAQTDPFPSNSVAWQDSRGYEDADKCAWNAASANIALGSHSYAVQPLWSNASTGCVMSY